MRCLITAMNAVVLALLLLSCTGSQVSYAPSVSFECRLSVWPTFEPPVEYLVQRDSFGRSTITEFRYRGAGGYDPKRVGIPIVQAIDSKQWGNFSECIRKNDPWAIPAKQPYLTGFDGTTMTLETRDRDRYHRIQRWAPFGYKSEKHFVELAKAVITLSPRNRR